MGNQQFTCVLCNDEAGSDGEGREEPQYTQFEDLQLAKVLGAGQFGEVKLAINRRTKDQFAVKVLRKSAMKADDLTALHAPSYDEEPGSVVEVDWYYASRLLSLGDDEIVKRAKERADAVLGDACAGATVVDAAVVRLPGAVNWYYPGSYQDMPSVAPGKEEKAKVAGCPANAFFAGDVVKSRHGSWSQEKAFVTGVEAANAILGRPADDGIEPLKPDEAHVAAGRQAVAAARGIGAPSLVDFLW